MFHQLKSVMSAGLLSLALVVGLAPAASASTGPWSWTDISDQLTVRNNRPVWAMAYANGYWFYTDGQDLWNGGQVYRFDGSTQANITNEVRNAGMSRVDDIVSDGQTVLFLKNVTSRNNSFEVVSFNGSYVNRTNALRSMFDSDTGAASVNGKNGVWTIVTTKGRVIRWDGSSNAIATFITNESPFKGDIAYSVRHASPADGYLHLPVAAVPIADGAWLVTVRESNGTIRLWKYASNGTATDLTGSFASMTYLHAIASNGTTALLAGGENSTSYTNRVYTYDGTNVRNVTSAASSLPFSSWNRVRIGWNASSWMILNGKDLVRFDGSSFQNLGRTRDYFVTLSGNDNKTFLVGGAESTDVIADGPAFPLVAKLVKVVEDGGNSVANGTFGGGNTYTSTNGPTIRTMGNPADFRVGNGGTFAYRATATDGNGVDRIDLYVNGARIKTCYGETCDFEAQYFTNGLSTRAVPFYARATDKLGYSTETAVENLTVDLNSTATANTNATNNSNTATSNDTTYWTWFEPNQTFIRRDQTMTYSAGAWNANGLKKIEIVVNGAVRRTCDLGLAYGNQTCTYTLYGFDYPLNTTVAVNAKITDGKDQAVWTPVQNLTVTDTNTGSNTTTNGDVSVWSWLDPSSSVLNRNASATLRTQAKASQGLNRVEVFVNGSLKRTCDFSRAYGTQSCDLTVYGTDYAAGSQVFMNAKATDHNGKTAWSDLKTVSVQDATNGTNTGSNTNASAWVWSNPETAELKTNATVAFNVGAYDADGLNKIEILANGAVVRTCSFGTAYGNRECAAALSGGSYPSGTNVFVNARITDVNGNVVWSPSRTYAIVSATATPSPTTNATQTWVWSHPDKTTLAAGESASFNVGAWDADGLRRIELWVNGQVKQICDFGTAYGNRECAVHIVADNYPAGTDVFVNASVIDGLGNVAWSNARTYRVQSSNISNGGSGFPADLPGSISVTSNADGGYTATQTITFSVNANDQDGIDRIDILVNGSLVKTCYNTSSCSYTGGPYGDRSSVSYGAKIVDKKGFALWTGYKTILKK